MRKPLIYSIAVGILSTVVVFALYIHAQKDEMHGFKREFNRQNLQIITVLQLPPSIFYFAGNSETNLYLKDIKLGSREIFVVDNSLLKFKQLRLKLPLDTSSKNRKVSIGLQDTTVYITDNILGEFTLAFENKYLQYTIPKIRLDQTSLLSRHSLVGREIDLKNGERQMYLTKINYTAGKITKSYKLEEQLEGLFSTDGMFKSDIRNLKFFYMYFYRGEFLCLDTSLNLLYKAKTIDTVTKAKIKLAKVNKAIDDERRTIVTQSTPPQAVSRNFSFDQNNLYLCSVIKSDGESSSDFRKNQVVDVYSISNGKYLNSFYIPKYKNKKLRDFVIKSGYIYAIFDTFIIKYQIISS